MAAPESLTTQIQNLVNSIQELDRPAIKAKLARFARLVKALEDGTATRKTEAKITRLKSALEASKSNYAAAYLALENSCSQIKDLQSELQTMQAEIAKYQKERAKQEEGEPDMPDIQFKILQRLPLVNEHGSNLDAIARGAAIPKDEAEIHLDQLCKAKPKALAWRTSSWPDRNNTGWRRTMAGNRYVVAKRLAGDAKEEKRYKHPDLPKPEDSILDVLAIPGTGFRTKAISSGLGVFFDTKISEAKTAYLLKEMKKRGFADFHEHAADGEPIWSLGEQGTEYLAERDRL